MCMTLCVCMITYYVFSTSEKKNETKSKQKNETKIYKKSRNSLVPVGNTNRDQRFPAMTRAALPTWGHFGRGSWTPGTKEAPL